MFAIHRPFRALLAASLAGALFSLSAVAATRQPEPLSAAQPRDVQFFVIVKSSNYQQGPSGELTLLNYHFFSELFIAAPGGAITAATLGRQAAGAVAVPYHDRGKTFYVEGGHFKSVEEVDRAYPNGTYDLKIETAHDGTISSSLALGTPGSRTDIPAPITILLQQQGKQIAPLSIDPSQPLEVRWSAYSNGRRDSKGIVDDMIFVVVQDCRGERIFHTGLPFSSQDYLRFDAPGVTVKQGSLRPGEPYSMFVEFPHVADSTMAGKTPGFASFATATYLDLHTAGAPSGKCPKAMPAMDTGQTNREKR